MPHRRAVQDNGTESCVLVCDTLCASMGVFGVSSLGSVTGGYDFFLVSQNVREGTVSPSHYRVVYDTTGLKPDHMQR